jgi:DNA-binding HxlR family transcriptional regulator
MGVEAEPREVEPTAPLLVRAHRQATPLAQALAAAGDRWTLLIVLALADGAVRLNTLRARLPGISSAVLDQHLRQMVTLGLISRRRFREMPPRVELELTESGTALLPIAGGLARWAMRYRWSSQEDGGERMDVDAVLRQLPALLEETELPQGVIDATVDSGERTVRHRFQISDGKLDPIDGTLTEERVPSVTITGDVTAWRAALGPARDGGGLRRTGQRRLAQQLLDALPPTVADDRPWTAKKVR